MNLFPLVATSIVSLFVGASMALFGSNLQAEPQPIVARSVSVEATISNVETFQPHEAQRLKPMGDILIWSSVVVPVSYKITFVTASEEIPLSLVRFHDLPSELKQGSKVWICYFNDARAERSILQVSQTKAGLGLCEDYFKEELVSATTS